MFILEVRRATGKGSINNGGHYQNDVLALEAAVNDEKRFPQRWAYFGFDRSDNAVPLPTDSACNSCHNQNAAVENTFVQFYPTLLEVATHKGTLNRAYVEKPVPIDEARMTSVAARFTTSWGLQRLRSRAVFRAESAMRPHSDRSVQLHCKTRSRTCRMARRLSICSSSAPMLPVPHASALSFGRSS